MASRFDPETREALLARVRFYRDLGLTDFYRRPVDAALLEKLAAAQSAAAAIAEPVPVAPALPSVPEPIFQPKSEVAKAEIAESAVPNLPFAPLALTEDVSAEETLPARAVIPAPPAFPQALDAVPPAGRAAALRIIQEEIGDCTRCALHTGRHKIVFGDGDVAARLMFVGEGPGADEDKQGLPFVGRAGQLLNNMIAAMGLKREEVYIANVVKCRPPGNRTPEPNEAHTCSPFLFRQIEVVQPDVLVALGATAATYLLGQRQPLAGLRGRLHSFRGSKLIVTYHPAYLLRDPRQKKEAWADLQIAMRELGLKPPARG